MSNYQFPTKGGLRFKHGPWTIGLWMQEDFGIGEMFVLGHQDGGGDWIVTARLDGPHFGWQARINQFGGMGNYYYAMLPTIRAKLKEHYDLTPHVPPLSNSTPYSREAFNFVASEFFKLVLDPLDDHPTIVPK